MQAQKLALLFAALLLLSGPAQVFPKPSDFMNNVAEMDDNEEAIRSLANLLARDENEYFPNQRDNSQYADLADDNRGQYEEEEEDADLDFVNDARQQLGRKRSPFLRALLGKVLLGQAVRWGVRKIGRGKK